MQEGVDAKAYEAGAPTPDLEEIRQLYSQLHKRGITLQKQFGLEAKLDDLMFKYSKRFGISRADIKEQLREERRLQVEVDRATKELGRSKEQWETMIKTGAKPPDAPSGGRIKADPGLEVPYRPSFPRPEPKVHERFNVGSQPTGGTAPGGFGGSRGGGSR